MKISRFVEELNKAIKEHGDVDLLIYGGDKVDLSPTIITGYSTVTGDTKCLLIMGRKASKAFVEYTKEAVDGKRI